MWTRTSRRSPPLYAKTLMKNMRRERVSLDPPKGQTDYLYPHPLLLSRTFCFPGYKFHLAGWLGTCSLKSLRSSRFVGISSRKQKARLQKESGFLNLELLKGDFCASCFESCLCLVCCLLVDLLKKGCWSCIDEILSFLKTKCRVEVTYFLDNRNLL